MYFDRHVKHYSSNSFWDSLFLCNTKEDILKTVSVVFDNIGPHWLLLYEEKKKTLFKSPVLYCTVYFHLKMGNFFMCFGRSLTGQWRFKFLKIISLSTRMQICESSSHAHAYYMFYRRIIFLYKVTSPAIGLACITQRF